MIRLGATAEDRITGFRGVITGRVNYVSGCNQSLLVPKVDKDGKVLEGQWFDDQRLLIDANVPIIELNNNTGLGADQAPPKR
jgi:hypothetical protein